MLRRWTSLLVLLGVAAMHGLGLLVVGCGSGHGAAAAPPSAHAALSAVAADSHAPAEDHHAAARPAGADAWTNSPTGCHLLHLCLAVLAGLGLLVLLGALARVSPWAVSAAWRRRVTVPARGPPRPAWGLVELCVSRT